MHSQFGTFGSAHLAARRRIKSSIVREFQTSGKGTSASTRPAAVLRCIGARAGLSATTFIGLGLAGALALGFGSVARRNLAAQETHRTLTPRRNFDGWALLFIPHSHRMRQMIGPPSPRA